MKHNVSKTLKNNISLFFYKYLWSYFGLFFAQLDQKSLLST